MPERIFHSLHEPPLLSDRLLAHGFGTVIAVWSVIAGIGLILSTILGVSLSPSITAFPMWLSIVAGAVIGGGGILASVGLLARIRPIDTSWMIEQTGWWLCGAGWSAYSLVVMVSFPASLLAWGTAGALAIGAALRIVVLHYVERDARSVSAMVEGRRLTGGDPRCPVDDDVPGGGDVD